jgi:hypothetical protein
MALSLVAPLQPPGSLAEGWLLDSQRTVRVYQYLGIPVHPLIELLVSLGSLVYTNLMRNDETGLRLSCDDQVSEITVVLLHIALASAECQTLSMVNLQQPRHITSIEVHWAHDAAHCVDL